MSISVFKTFSAGEVLTAADLNASLTQITSNGTDVAFPLTKNSSLGGFSLFFDAASTRSMTDAAKGVNLAGTAFNDAKTTVASAAAADIWTSTGALIDYTGTVTATSFAAASQAGSRRTLLCAGAAPFTAGANMLIDGYASGSTFTATAGDTVDVIAVTTTQFRLKPRLYSGNPVNTPVNVCEFRLTLTTALPVTTSDVTAAATVFWTPYKGNHVGLYDGSQWNIRTSAQLSIDVTLLSADKLYDVFVYDNAGTPTLETLVWTNDTTRATALAFQDGVYVKSGATTRRYVGTFRTNSSTRVHDALVDRWVWNYYNRVLRTMRVTEATDTWAYTTATWRQARASTANQLDFVIGVAEDAVTAKVHCFGANTNAGVNMIVGIGYDTTSSITSGCLCYSGAIQVANAIVSLDAELTTIPTVGRHFLSWNEYSDALGTSTFYGDGGAPTTSQSGIHGWVWA